MTKKNVFANLAPVVKYECPVCKASFGTKRECVDHLINHDDMVLTLYLDREENGEFTFDMTPVRPVDPAWAERHSKPLKSICCNDRWYVEVPDDPARIAKAKKELVHVALKWYRAGLDQLEALETNPKQKEE